MPDFGILEALAAVGSALGLGGTAAGTGALGTAAASGLGAGVGAGAGAGLTGSALAGGAGSLATGISLADALAGGTAAAGTASSLAGTGADALAGLTEAGHSLGGAAAAEGAGSLGSVLATGGNAGLSAAGLAPDLGSLGGQGFATGLDSGAGSLGSEFSGSLGDVLQPATSLPTGPEIGGSGPISAPLTGVDITPAVNTAGSPLAGVEPGSFSSTLGLQAGDATSNIGQFLQAPDLNTGFNALLANKDLLSLGAAALPLLSGPSAMPGEEQLQNLASQMSSSSTALQGYLRSGTLPPGVQAGLNSARESAKAAMRSMFASRGMSGSSSEIASLANIDQTTAAQGAEIAMKLLDKGIQQSQLSSLLYQTILKNAMEQDKEMGAAVGRFSAALAA